MTWHLELFNYYIIPIIIIAAIGPYLFYIVSLGLVPLIKRIYEPTSLINTKIVENPKAIVFLVHGTWARCADWTLPGSNLRKSISSIFDGSVVFKQFMWSGKNTMNARNNATIDLKEQLENSLREHTGSDHFVIAHSHGGNIALRAITEKVKIK